MSPETRELGNFKPTIQRLTQAAIDRGDARAVGVFFRDLMNGRWFGVGDDIDYNIASMGKVAMLAAYLRHADTNPEVLDRWLVIESTEGYQFQNIPPKRLLQAGKAYKVSELLEQMIVHSDNIAGFVLEQNLPDPLFEETTSMFGFELAANGVGFNASPRRFSGLFRVLFNASYVSRARSISALELLTRTQFKDGLVAGVPPSVRVAHKFGERIDEVGSQMHDCGIVYYPNRPYFLCIMTKGRQFENLASVIRDVSHAVYREVDWSKQTAAP